MSIVLGFVVIQCGDVIQHRVASSIVGMPHALGRALLMGTGWVINLTVAEWISHKRSAPLTRWASIVVVPLQ